jgi:hypothetical protein
MIAVGENNFISIPLPHGFRSFYGLGVIGHQLETGQVTEGKALTSSVGHFIDQMSPIPVTSVSNKKGGFSGRPLIPTPFVPIYDIAFNEDYMGNEVYNTPFMKTWDNKIADSKLGKSFVSKPIKNMTDWLYAFGTNDKGNGSKSYVEDGKIKKVSELYDWNPSKIEHTLEGYFGGLGKFGTDLVKTSSGIIESADHAITENKSFKDELSKNVSVSMIPIANKFYSHATGDSGMKKFNVVRDQVEQYEFLKSQGKKDINTDLIESLYGVDNMEGMTVTYKTFKTQIDNLSEKALMAKDPAVIEELLAAKKELINDLVRSIEELTKTKIKF